MEGLIIFIYFLPTILCCFIRSGSNDDKIWFFLYNLTAAWAIIPWFMMMHVVIEELSNENKMGQTEERLGSFDTRSNAHNITIEAIFEKPKVRIQPGEDSWPSKNARIDQIVNKPTQEEQEITYIIFCLKDHYCPVIK